MAATGEDASLGASQKTEKKCSVCQVPVKAHVGKHGPNNCLGQSSTEIFQRLLSEIEHLKRSFEAERVESKDREVRLLNKIDDLGRRLMPLATSLTVSLPSSMTFSAVIMKRRKAELVKSPLHKRTVLRLNVLSLERNVSGRSRTRRLPSKPSAILA